MKASKFELTLRWCNAMSIGQNIQPEIILWFSWVLKIDTAGVSHNLDLIFRNITVGTFDMVKISNPRHANDFEKYFF